MGDASAPTKGGYKQAGEMSEKTRAQNDATVQAILENWKITAYQHAFPKSIRPTSLGTSAISYLRGISRRVSLAVAQGHFLAECKDSNGAPTTAGFGNILKVHKHLVDTETANAAAQKTGQENTEKKPTPRRRSTEGPKKTVTTPKVPNGLVPSGKGIHPPFKFSGTPPVEISISNERSKPRTKEVPVAKKTAPEGSGLEKPSQHQSAFGFLDAPPTVPKKRSGAVEFNDAKQGVHHAAKKARKEESAVHTSVQTPHASKLDDQTSALKPIKSLSEELFGIDDKNVKPSSATKSFSNDDDDDKKFAVLQALMEEAKAANAHEVELTKNKIAAPTTSVFNGKEAEFNSETPTLAPTMSKETLATLNPGEMEITIPGLEGNTMVVDVDATKHHKGPVRRANFKQITQGSSSMSSQSNCTEDVDGPKVKSNGFSVHSLEAKTTPPKPANVAPVANMGYAPSASEKSSQQVQKANTGKQTAPDYAPASLMEAIHQSKCALSDEATIVPQPSLVQTMAINTDPQTDGFKEHCGWISHGLREVLDTQKLKDLARPDQRDLARDLHAVFETTMRHLEGDIAWVFKKHGAEI